MTFAVSRAAAFGRSHARSVERIDKIHIHRDVKPGGIQRCDLDGFSYDVWKSALIQFAHGEHTDADTLDEFTLARINAARADDRHIFRQNLWRESGDVRQLTRALAEKRRKRHPVDVSRRGRLRGVHIGVCVQPDDTDSLIELAIIACDSGDTPDCDGVIAAKYYWQRALLQPGFHHGRQFLGCFSDLG